MDQNQRTAREGQKVQVQAQLLDGNGKPLSESELAKYEYEWTARYGPYQGEVAADPARPWMATFDTSRAEIGTYSVSVRISDPENASFAVRESTPTQVSVEPRTVGRGDDPASVDVTLQRAGVIETPDQALWVVIRKSVEALSFNKYEAFMDAVMCGREPGEGDEDTSKGRRYAQEHSRLRAARALPYSDVEAYRRLKVATEVYMMVNCGVALDSNTFEELTYDASEESRRFGRRVAVGDVEDLWDSYLRKVNGSSTIPYLALIRSKLKELPLKDASQQNADNCYGILLQKLTNPCLLELLWSYWMEVGRTVDSMRAISLRFQNRRGMKSPDPLAHMEIGPLRLLNNLLWGYIQDEQHRLTRARRSYEYDHHYGVHLNGRGAPALRPADSRSKFIEAFHNLLHLCSGFYKQDDDTTVIADGFPVLNGLKEVHLLLSQGAHNQFGDLPWTARQEMLLEQWLLARPEMREFLPSRTMVAYPEGWMDRVEAMKKLQGWSDTPILHFRDLAVFGEPILLGIRYGAWSALNEPAHGANWARYWRPEVQNYIHSYRAVTGVDLTAETTETRLPSEAYLPPAVHLRRRAAEGQSARRDQAASPARNGKSSRARDEAEFLGGY